MKVAYQLSGFAELDALLKQLPKSVARKVTRQALRKAGAIVRDEMKVLAPVETGELRRSVRVMAGKTRTRTKTAVFVGISGRQGPLAHLIEFGSAAHTIATKNKRVLHDRASGKFFGKVVKHPGTPARPFVRPAADAKASEVIATLAQELGAGIENEALLLVRAGGLR